MMAGNAPGPILMEAVTSSAATGMRACLKLF
jgi:hypothetical protein